MTLLIAFILIKAFGLHWTWALAASLTWIMHVAFHENKAG